MVGSEGQGGQDPPLPSTGLVSLSMLEEFKREMLTAIRLALAPAGGSSAPSVLAPMLATPALAKHAPGQRSGREGTSEGSTRDLLVYELFPSPASTGCAGEPTVRVEPAIPLRTGSPFCELILQAPVPEKYRGQEMTYYSGRDDPVQHVQWFEDIVYPENPLRRIPSKGG